MKKNSLPWLYCLKKSHFNYLIQIMRIILFLIFFCSSCLFAENSYSQKAKATINQNDVMLESILNEIENQTDYLFIYSKSNIDVNRRVSVNAKNKSVKDILQDVFEDTNVDFVMEGSHIILSYRNKQNGENPEDKAATTQQNQGKKIVGQITDESGTPLPGVSVILKGTAKGTTSGMDGSYLLENVPEDAVLTFSYLGFMKREIKTGGKTILDIVLAEDIESLEEVVVVGYGTQKKLSLTGAISSISNRDIQTTKSPSLAVALAGKVPGLQIRQNNGLPGSFNTNINVRGMGTPMFVIDGVVRNESTEFQKLNPEDIESVTVLKDASAAIYGINSSNGVILVKTKNGTKGPLRISYNGLFGTSAPTQHTPMMNVSQYWEIRNEEGVNSGGSPYFSTPEALKEAQALPYTNWYNEVFKKSAFQQQQNIILEGGGDKISTYLNIGYNTDNGILKSGDIGYDKYSFRNATSAQINQYLKADLSLYGYTDCRKQPGTWDDAFFYMNKAVHGLIPSETVFANNDPLYYNRPKPQNDNPVQFSQRDIFGYGEWRDQFFQSSLAITFDIPKVKGLKIKAQGAFDAKTYIRTRVQKRAINYTYSESTNSFTPYNNYDPSIQEESTNLSRLNLQGYIMYNTEIARKHSIGAVFVAEGRHNKNRYLSGKRFYEGDLFTIDNIDRAPTTNQQTGGNTGEEKYLSFIGRINYNFMDKYLLEFAFREDGSYRYDPDRRWGFFPVFSVGWRLSEENFIKSNTSIITNLKIRGSHGTTAQDQGNAFQYVPGYSSYNGYVMDNTGKYVSGFTNAGLINPNLTWTISVTTDIGVDLDLWNGELDFSFDVYRRNRDGLLATRIQALPNTFGATLPQENLNSDRTEGFEFLIGHRNSVNEFTYGVSANMNIGRSMMTYRERAPFRSSMDRWKNGEIDRWQDIGWGYQVIGQYQNYDAIRNGVIETTSYANSRTLPGDYIHLDVNGDGVISDKDRMPIFWNGQPKMNFGLTTFAAWKGFDFNMLWQGSGLYSLKYGEILGQVLALDNSNSPAIYYDRWHLEDVYNPDSKWIPGNYPATRRLDSDNGANRIESDIQRVDATYARLKNIELGYTISNRYLTKLGIRKLRFYVNAFNLVVICNDYLKSFDPEITDGNGFQYPLSRSYNLGVNLTF
jgi:TonB-linked SusC/RagA family outer membrane protein